MPEGARIAAPYWYETKLTSINQKFVEIYVQEFGFPPSYEAERAYTAVRLFQMAATKAGGTDKEALVYALERIQVQDDALPSGAFTMSPEDHQGRFSILWGRVSKQMRAVGPRSRHIMRSLVDIRILSPDDLGFTAWRMQGQVVRPAQRARESVASL